MKINSGKSSKSGKNIIVKMKEVRLFDVLSISISPSLLKNQLDAFFHERDNFYNLKSSAAKATSALSVLISVEDYKNFLGIDGIVWQAFFMFVFLAFLLRFLKLGISFLFTTRRRPPSSDDFVDSLLSK